MAQTFYHKRSDLAAVTILAIVVKVAAFKTKGRWKGMWRGVLLGYAAAVKSPPCALITFQKTCHYNISLLHFCVWCVCPCYMSLPYDPLSASFILWVSRPRGDSHMEGWRYSSEILNLTPKRDQSGCCQTLCRPLKEKIKRIKILSFLLFLCVQP